MDDLERYIADHIPPEDSLLTALDRETHLRVIQPRMISGHLQGQLLKMLVLQAGGEIHTIEIDDELEEIAAKYFREAEQNIQGRIIQHIGSALDLAPGLGIFDLIFIDGDKREYPQYYEMAMRSLVHSGSYLLADNILWYGKVAEQTPAGDRFTEGIKQFNRMVTEDDRVENVILPLRDGLNLIRVK